MSYEGQEEYEVYIDEALEALGGENAPDIFIISQGAQVSCPDCGPIYTLGSIEVWELVADARKHYEEVHSPAVVFRQRQLEQLDQLEVERMDGEHG